MTRIYFHASVQSLRQMNVKFTWNIFEVSATIHEHKFHDNMVEFDLCYNGNYRRFNGVAWIISMIFLDISMIR